ncbi:FliH/SctL family protein [Microbacterium sp.]|uniref:FliH/SctL family protein n=1 Tax=Microbacterium sp. TaxID=51671 RepID=UPI00281156B3|nr:FliH/SctL family protein [Microbacterium sp.]
MSTDRPALPAEPSRPRASSRFTQAVFPRIAGRSTELEREFEAARVRGYAAGHAEGMRAAAEAAALLREEIERAREDERIAAERRVTQALVAVEAAALSLADRERELVAAGQRALERLAVELAETVVARELAAGEASAHAALRRVLAHVDLAEARELRVSAGDLDTLRALGGAPEGVTLVADPQLAPGDAVAVLPDGSVDARVAAAFARARAALEDLS